MLSPRHRKKKKSDASRRSTSKGKTNGRKSYKDRGLHLPLRSKSDSKALTTHSVTPPASPKRISSPRRLFVSLVSPRFRTSVDKHPKVDPPDPPDPPESLEKHTTPYQFEFSDTSEISSASTSGEGAPTIKRIKTVDRLYSVLGAFNLNAGRKRESHIEDYVAYWKNMDTDGDETTTPDAESSVDVGWRDARCVKVLLRERSRESLAASSGCTENSDYSSSAANDDACGIVSVSSVAEGGSNASSTDEFGREHIHIFKQTVPGKLTGRTIVGHGNKFQYLERCVVNGDDNTVVFCEDCHLYGNRYDVYFAVNTHFNTTDYALCDGVLNRDLFGRFIHPVYLFEEEEEEEEESSHSYRLCRSEETHSKGDLGTPQRIR